MLSVTRILLGAVAAGAMLTAAAPLTPAAATCSVQPSWQPSACRTITFSDSFNGTSVNHSKWAVTAFGGLAARGCSGPFNPGYETARYCSRNVSEASGSLRLALTHVSSGTGYPWTGAVVQTSPTFHQLYGAFEARVYLPPNATNRIIGFPAWWTNGWHIEWARGGENDIVEGLNDNFAGQAASHIWYGPPSVEKPIWGYDDPHPMGGWHRFGIAWSSSGWINFYYDGHKVAGHSQPGRAPHYLLFDNALAPDSIQPPGTGDVMRVDWVRVWR